MTHQKSYSEYTLNDIMTIQAGYPFRGAILEVPNGDVKVVQPKDISPLGELITRDLTQTNLTGKRKPDWLKKGDLLFIAKGYKHWISCVLQDLPQTTCSPSLFLLRVKPEWENKVNMQFLAWMLNQQRIQNYFKRSAEGSFQTSIRRAVLEKAPIVLPSKQQQDSIAKLYAASIKENVLLTQLIDNRQKQLNAIAEDLQKQVKPTFNE